MTPRVATPVSFEQSEAKATQELRSPTNSEAGPAQDRPANDTAPTH